MKKIAFILSTFILSFSINSQQIVFEKTLGKENVETLNLLIEDFETNTLKKKYPSLKIENAYKEFLKDILKNNTYQSNKTFAESKLKLNIYGIPDSIWIEKRTLSSGKKTDQIKTKYKLLNENNEIVYTSTTTLCCNERENTLTLFENEKRSVQVNMVGSYIKALEKVSNESKIIESYLENIKMTADPIPFYAMSEYILNNNIDTNDYIVKRLIFINMVYR